MSCLISRLFITFLFLLAFWGSFIPALQAESVTPKEQNGESEEEKSTEGRYRVLPIPIFITEPAIGEGLGVALALFHPVKEGVGSVPRATTPTSIGQMDADKQAPPPVVTGVFGAYTNSESWAAGIGHMNNWREDSVRYAGALASARINSKFYVLGVPIKYTLEGDVIYQDIKFRIAGSNFFLGTAFSYLSATNEFRHLPDNSAENITDPNIRDVGLAFLGSYDKRDNTLNPNKGQLVDLSLWRYDEAIGGQYDYWSSRLKALSFHHFHDRFTLGLRFDIAAVDGKAPFYGYPWVKLRGIPAMRYQDERAGAMEIEGRYQLAQKWEVLGFAGLGFTDGDTPIFDNPGDIYNYGVGGRYKVIEEQNVWVGLDVAKGPEEWNWYIQVGHAW